MNVHPTQITYEWDCMPFVLFYKAEISYKFVEMWKHTKTYYFYLLLFTILFKTKTNKQNMKLNCQWSVNGLYETYNWNYTNSFKLSTNSPKQFIPNYLMK